MFFSSLSLVNILIDPVLCFIFVVDIIITCRCCCFIYIYIYIYILFFSLILFGCLLPGIFFLSLCFSGFCVVTLSFVVIGWVMGQVFDAVWADIDADGSGEITFNEFVNYCVKVTYYRRMPLS